ncbi:MAG: M48 family metallopeptidase [Alphaproteobacteria bacterium]|nr:M48 family metallopeptidase [Alphaproteobacteria bacterium]
MANGAGHYFDGATSARHAVAVEAASDGLRIIGADGAEIARWPYADLRAQPAPDHVMRLRQAGGLELARLEIHDAVLIAEIDHRADSLDRTGTVERRLRKRVIGWTVAATVSLVLVAIFGVPVLSDRIAPLTPLSVEHRLGQSIDAQVRAMLDTKSSGKPFECGTGDAEQAGRAARDALIKRLETAAGLPIALKTAVVRRSETNAVALPGGHIYVFEGLIARSRSVDEVAGVIAHEIGHVAHRDGTRSLLEAAGLSFLFGMLLGDFTGGGLVVIAARTVVQSAYSRDVEANADLYGVNLMAKAGGDPRALGTILDRIAGAIEPGSKILADHPETKDRIAAINAAAHQLPVAPGPLLSPAEWTALKGICG